MVMRSSLRSAAPAILLAALVLVPFADKAFTIDDTFFLRGGQQAASDPLHPSAFDIVWFDAPERVGPSFGALMAWLLVPAVLSEHPERVAHAVELLFASVALLATVALAMRLGLSRPWAVAAGLLLAATPTFLGMAGTAMPDIPALALATFGVERVLAWKQERRIHQAVAATLLLGLAPLARLHAFEVLGVAALLVVGDFMSRNDWRRVRVADAAPLLGGILVTALVFFLIRDPAPGAPGAFGVTTRMSSAANVAYNAVGFAAHWVLAVPLALAWILLRPVRTVRRWWILPVAFGGVYVLLAVAGRWSALLWVLGGIGAAALVDIVSDAIQRRDSLQAVLGLWLLVPLAAAPYVHFPAKYNLLSAPAAVILLARELAALPRRRAMLVLGCASVLGVALGAAILRADAQFADLGRRAAAELIAPRVASGQRVWFVGHWGFQWYAERAGARPVTVTPPYPEPGDLLVVSDRCDKGLGVVPMLVRDVRASFIARLGDRSPGGRLTSEGAGFFSNNHGHLPWTWGTGVLDEFILWRIDRTRYASTR
jgi:4-amino-4-deoxy-L-arabinose transferase-like glycosyltransferase